MILGMDIANTEVNDLKDCGRLVRFMESTDFDRMAPRDDLAYGGTEYVLALPGESYIAYSSSLSGRIGLKGMLAGVYDFSWYDPTSGATVREMNVSVAAGHQVWQKPTRIGREVAVYIKRTAPALPRPLTRER
jgi:hypothetical protein